MRTQCGCQITKLDITLGAWQGPPAKLRSGLMSTILECYDSPLYYPSLNIPAFNVVE